MTKTTLAMTTAGIFALLGLGSGLLLSPEREVGDLCEIDNGRWCEPCGGEGDPECPQGDEGPLCCTSGICSPWVGEVCHGDLGWCMNYTTHIDEVGHETATCHDQQ